MDGLLPHTLHSSSQTRPPARRNDYDSATRSSDHGRLLTSSRKRKKVKRVKSTRANKKKIWTQVYQGFRFKEVQNKESDGDENEDETPEGSVDRFKHEVLPLSTAREKRIQGQREAKERMDDDPASQYDLVEPDPRKPLKRFSTFMGEEDLDNMTKENQRRLLRRPPYRTISTDAQQLDFVSPSDALLEGTYDLTSFRRRQKPGEEKVKRLAPGKTPRIPFLYDFDQTGFAVQPPDLAGPRALHKITDRMFTDEEVARIAKKGNGWVSTKRKKRNKTVGKKSGLEMVKEEEAIDTAKIDPTYTSYRYLRRYRADSLRFDRFIHEPPVKVKKARKSLLKRAPQKVEFRFIPRRLPPPIRPFARRPPPVLVPEPRLTESIQTAGSAAAKSASLSGPVQPSPSLARPPPKPIKPSFRFIVGPKANRAPTVLIADTPIIETEKPVAARPKRYLTFSSPLPDHPAEHPQRGQVDHSSQAHEGETFSRPKKKQKLMRRLSTLPDFNLTHDRKQDEIEEVIIEPDATFNQYAKSNHSNSSPHPLANPAAPLPPLPSHRQSFDAASLPPPPHQAEPTALFHPSHQLQFNDSNDYFPSSSFERDVLAVLENNDEEQQTRSSTRNYIAQLQNQQESQERVEAEQEQEQSKELGDPASSTRWWIGGPTVSAARGTAESDILPFHYRGGVQSEDSMIGYDDGEETEVVGSSMTATIGGASGRGGEEEEEPPGSILQGLDA